MLTVQVIVRIGHHELLQTKGSFPITIEMTKKGLLTDTGVYYMHLIISINLNTAQRAIFLYLGHRTVFFAVLPKRLIYLQNYS